MKAIEHYDTLAFNPFVLLPLLEIFYKELPQQKNTLLLAYLIFPLCTNSMSREVLNIRVMSGTSSLVMRAQERKNGAGLLFGLHENIQRFKQLTNDTLQYGFTTGRLSLNLDNSVSTKLVKIQKEEENLISPSMGKAAKNFAKLVSNLDVVNVYITLKVPQL